MSKPSPSPKTGIRSGRVSVGHPVDVATGTQSDEFSDHILPGRVPLTLGRRYSTTMPKDSVGMFGPGWSSPFEMFLCQDVDGYKMRAEDGESDILFDDPDGAIESGGIARNLGMFCELSRVGRDYIVTKWNPDDQDVTQYVFEQGNPGERWLLCRQQDLTGQAVHIERDVNQRVISVRQKREGRGYQFTYSPAGRVTEVAVAVPGRREPRVIARYVYDAAGRLCEHSNALGQRSSYEYDDQGRMIREVNLAGMVYHFRYDAQGRCIENTGLEGYGRVTLRINSDARMTEATDALDNVTIYRWNETGQVEQQISPLGRETTTIFDEHGRIVQKIEPSGAKTSYAFDERGDRVKVISPTEAVTQYAYNDRHQAICITDAAGHTWQRTYNEAGQIASVTNPLGQTLTYSYGARGDLVEVKDSVGRRWGLNWSETGDLLSHTDALGHATRYEYNLEGDLHAIISARGHRTEVRLDELGRVVEVRLPDGARRRMARNAYHQITEFVDEVGAVSRWRYAGCGLLLEEVRPHGGRIQYEWSSLPGQLLAVRNELGERYSFEYDPDGRLVKETDFAGRVTRYEHGKGNEASAIRNAAGERIELKRNAAGALLEVAHSRDAVTKYAYDERGLLLKADNGSCPVEREYDPLRRLVREKQGEHEILSTYDAAGNRVKRQSSLGSETLFDWDENGRLIRHTPDGLTPLHFQYDEEGNELRRFVEDGVEIAHKYDCRGRRAEQRVGVTADNWLERVSSGAEGILRREYKYDAASNLTEILDRRVGKTEYRYDPAGRIVAAVLPQGYSERFTYDAADNLTAHVQNDVMRRLSYGPGNTLRERDGVVYEHDVLGQLVRKKESQGETTYSWDAQGMLAKVALPDGSVWTYRYDALGRRVEKQGPTERTEFVWDGDVVLHEVRQKEGTEQERVDWEFEQDGFAPIGKVERGVRYFCINDVSGAPQELVTKEGHVGWAARFSTWRMLLSTSLSEVDCPVRFQGQWHDPETGLHYNRNRYYDPENCRFISYDPIGLLGGLNTYQYALNPMGWIDPYGLSDRKCTGCDDCSKANDTLVRRGKDKESATRLAARAQDAEAHGFPHGVSVTTPASNQRLSKDPSDAMMATKKAFEDAGFTVHHTPTSKDPQHHTVELPKPVTPEVAKLFNSVLGR